MSALSFKILKKEEGERLDIFLASKKVGSRSKCQKLIKGSNVLVNGEACKSGYELEKGDVVGVTFPKPEKIQITFVPKVIFENKDFLILEKPAGISVQEGNAPKKETITLALLLQFPNLEKFDPASAGICHRLDKDTSGLLIVAKNKKTKEYFGNLFKSRKISKKYIALVWGRAPQEGIIEAPLKRSKTDKRKIVLVPDGEGRMAVTHFRAKKVFKEFTLLEVVPKTGRMHQIRVHLWSIGHPVVGDKVYGRHLNKKSNLGRHFLHASELGFKGPDGKQYKFKSKLPKELERFLKKLTTDT